MEGFQKLVRKVSKDSNLESSIPSLPENPFKFSSNGGNGTPSLSSSEHSSVLITRHPSRHVVSLWTCSKLCAVFFVAGVVVGYTLKRRVRRWASRLLRRLKDD